MAGEGMFGRGMNGLASYWAGQQQASSQAQQQAQLASLMQQQQRESQMLPLDLEAKRAGIAAENARLPGIMGQSQSMQAQGQFDQNTISSKVQAELAKHKSQMSQSELEQMGTMGTKMMQAAQVIEQAGVPPPQQAQAMSKILSEFGVDPSSSFVAPLLQKVDPRTLTTVMKQVGEGLAKTGTQFIQNSALAGQAEGARATEGAANRASQEKIASGQQATALEVARINSAARMQAQQARADMQRNKPQSIDQAIAQLAQIPEEERTPAEQKALEQLSKQKLAQAAAGANPLPGRITGNETPQDIAASTGVFNQAGGGAPAGNNVASAVQAAGWQYEPNKYEYRIGPDGKVQRRPLKGN